MDRTQTPASTRGARSLTLPTMNSPACTISRPDTSPGPTGHTPVSPAVAYRRQWVWCSTLVAALDDVHGFDALGQQHMNVPESQGPSIAGPSTVPYPVRPAQSPSPPPATFTWPRTTPSPVPTLSWGCKCSSYLRWGLDHSPTSLDSPLPTTLYATAGNNQPLTGKNSSGQWPYPTSVGKGKTRATDHLPIRPSTTGNTSK
jgi:hypothetical protein